MFVIALGDVFSAQRFPAVLILMISSPAPWHFYTLHFFCADATKSPPMSKKCSPWAFLHACEPILGLVQNAGRGWTEGIDLQHSNTNPNPNIGSARVFGSRPSDHYFRSVCLFVCLSVCLFVCLCRVFSAVFDPIWIKLGNMLHVQV